jgi:hypothetical protein
MKRLALIAAGLALVAGSACGGKPEGEQRAYDHCHGLALRVAESVPSYATEGGIRELVTAELAWGSEWEGWNEAEQRACLDGLDAALR